MSQLGSRTTADTANQHVGDHNELHRLHNQLDDDAASNGDMIMLAGGDWSSDTPANHGISQVGHSHVEADVTNLDHDDPDALHSNQSGEIQALTQKTTPVSADMLLIEDSAASGAKKKVPWSSLPEGGVSPGGSGLTVTNLSANTTLTESGVYIVDTSGGNRTITLPLLSTAPADGFRIQVIRTGPNFLYVQRQGSDDYWDNTQQRTVADDAGAVSVVAGATSSDWMELGRWRTVF